MSETSVQERIAFVRLGGISAIVGGLGYIISGAIHQALPSGPEQAVPHVAARPEWYAIHLLAMLSVALWPVTFVALAESLIGVWSRVFRRIAVGAMLVGLVLFIMEMALDGHVLKNLSDAWAATSGPAQDEEFMIARSAYAVLQGNFAVTLIWTTGVPFLFVGVALLQGRPYPRWTGWAVLLFSALITAFGLTYYLRIPLIPQLIGHVIPSFLLASWLIVIGVIMIRRAPTNGSEE